MRYAVLRSFQTTLDITVLCLAYLFAFFIRFDWLVTADIWSIVLVTLPFVVVLQYLLLLSFGVPRLSWRFFSLREAINVAHPLAWATTILLTFRLVIERLPFTDERVRLFMIPIGVILADSFLSVAGVVGIRVLRRLLAEHKQVLSVGTSAKRTPTLLIGAGQAGFMVARELAGRPDLQILPIGFLDDDPGKLGTVIQGVPVLGKTTDIASVVARHHVEQVLITIANAPGSEIRRVRALCEEAQLPTKIIPGLYEIVTGTINLKRIRDVAIEDLLRRPAVKLDESSIAASVVNKTVLVTGAGGSIGSELCRQLARYNPKRLVLVERAENSLFQIHLELTRRFGHLSIVPYLADIGETTRMHQIFGLERPSLVFHAAAHKHVPLMEVNSLEALRNNVFGTQNVADVASKYQCERFVLISTDKAVNPASVMGATKRLAELYTQSLTNSSSTKFMSVRFGNVLGSNGSVIPIFQKQISEGGPVTVTHPDMRRYFMTIPEASQLVLQASVLGQGGEVFLLDMGEPVRIVDLARDLIELSGFIPDEDIEIKFTGIRPGEKLFEELTVADESTERTAHPEIYLTKGRVVTPGQIHQVIQKLDKMVARSADVERFKSELLELIRSLDNWVVSDEAKMALPHSQPALAN